LAPQAIWIAAHASYYQQASWFSNLTLKPRPAVYGALVVLDAMLPAIPFSAIELVETEWRNVIAAFIIADMVQSPGG
jgi:hypothetical protein